MASHQGYPFASGQGQDFHMHQQQNSPYAPQQQRQQRVQSWHDNPQYQYPQQYPPSSPAYNNMSSTQYSPNNIKDFNTSSTRTGGLNGNAGRELTRTPSPTPSELKELGTGAIDWKLLMNWRFWIRKEWIWYYLALAIILTLTGLMTIYHKQIVGWLTPVTHWLHDLKFGWLVPIGVLFVISFPPLFGHEIVAVLCGLVWGLWVGFGIVAAGTLLGEIGNFYAFKYCCRARGEKLEKGAIWYACLSKVTRDGGFKIALIARLSAIPGHFTTAIFATCGMNIFVFTLAAILSMPKQFITVYLGVILEQSSEPASQQDPKSKIISDVVLAVTVLITILACWYILHRMNVVKPEVIYARRKARQAKMMASTGPYANEPFYAGSETEIPLTATKNGNIIIAPKPKTGYNQYGYHKEEEYSGSDESSEDTTIGYRGGQEQRGQLNVQDDPRNRDRFSGRRIDSEEVGWNVGNYYQNNRTPTSPKPPGIDNQVPRVASPEAMYDQRRSPGPAGPNRRQSAQMQASPTHQQPPPTFYIPPPGSYSPRNLQPQQQRPSEYSNPPAIHLEQPSSDASSTVVGDSLPTPNYPNQTFNPPAPSSTQRQQHNQPPPQQSHHMHEATNMTYHTAYGSEDSSDGFINDGHHHGAEPSDASVYFPGGYNGNNNARRY